MSGNTRIVTARAEDALLLEGIRRSDKTSVRQLYDQYLPGIIRYVRNNNGTEEDARDVFQEAVIVIFRKITEDHFTLTSSLQTFLLVVCRNLWRKHLRDNQKYAREAENGLEEKSVEANIETQIEANTRDGVFFRHFDQLTENCRQILMWFFDKVPMKEIARRMDTSESYVKKRKFICKQKLVEAVKNDPVYKEIASSEV